MPKPVFNDTYELWPLGIMFFEAASGRLPFEPEKGRDDAKAMYQMIANKEANFISPNKLMVESNGLRNYLKIVTLMIR